MPAAFARSAMSAPARDACSIGLRPRRSASVQLTAASVRPASSSTSWAKMPRLERNTAMRGRSAVPRTLARTRRRRLRRRWGDVTVLMRDCSAWWSAHWRGVRAGCGSCPLAYLPGDVLALVADALALVGLRGPLLADDGGDLADLLLARALHDDARGLRHLELDALRRLDRHGMRVAERELEVAALELGAIADALDLERLREAGGDALDHVGDQRPRETVQRAMLGAVGRPRDEQLAVLLLHLDDARLALLEVAARTGHAHDLGLDRHGDRVGDWDGLPSDAGHRATRPRRRPRRRRPPFGRRDRSSRRGTWTGWRCPCRRAPSGRAWRRHRSADPGARRAGSPRSPTCGSRCTSAGRRSARRPRRDGPRRSRRTRCSPARAGCGRAPS